MRIISHRQFSTSKTFLLCFPGFAFDCDANGKVDVSKLQPAALKNYQQVSELGGGEIVTLCNRQVIPAVGECNQCGKDVELHGFTNTCECGVDYNMSGQELAPRSQWGEETGEHIFDILSADTDYLDV